MSGRSYADKVTRRCRDKALEIAREIPVLSRDIVFTLKSRPLKARIGEKQGYSNISISLINFIEDWAVQRIRNMNILGKALGSDLKTTSVYDVQCMHTVLSIVPSISLPKKSIICTRC